MVCTSCSNSSTWAFWKLLPNGPQMGFHQRVHFAIAANWGKCNGYVTRARNATRCHHILAFPSVHQTETRKLWQGKIKRHARNHSEFVCCTNINAQPHTEQTQSAEQVLRCDLTDRRHHRGLQQLKQTSMCSKTEQNHGTLIAQGRTQRATATIVCQTHGSVHRVPASRSAINPTASTVRVERNINAVRQVNQWEQSCDGLRRHLRGPVEVYKHWKTCTKPTSMCPTSQHSRECWLSAVKRTSRWHALTQVRTRTQGNGNGALIIGGKTGSKKRQNWLPWGKQV